MKPSKLLVVVPFLVAVCASPAFSQQPTDLIERGHVSGAAGAITNSPVEAVFFAEYSENVGRHAQAYANVSYMTNMMPSATRDAVDVAAAQYSALLGSPAPFVARDRGVSFTVGGRYLVNSRGVIQPYLGGGAGVVSIKRTITNSQLGDVTQAVFTEFGVGSIALVGPESANKPIGEIVGGIGFVASHTVVDIGYKYRRVFDLGEYNFSQVTAGIGYKW